jgi:hypothetical protein
MCGQIDAPAASPRRKLAGIPLEKSLGGPQRGLDAAAGTPAPVVI